MLKKANISWNARQLAKMAKNGNITFDNAVQRGLVWDTKRKSLLIHSMIVGYPIPAFYAAKNENGYDMLDGKQRINAITGFLNGEFELTDVPEVEVENEDGSTDWVDINTLHFDELEEALRDEIANYSLTIYYFDGITDEEISEMFFRLNNGKPLSAIELSRVKAKSLETVMEIGKHDLFKSALTEKALAKYTNEDIVIKSYAMLHEEEPSMDTKFIRPLMENADITDADKRQLEEIFTRILNVHGLIEDTKVAKRILVRTHLISIVPMIWKSLEDGLSDQQVAEWLSVFFNGTKRTTISDIYNNNARDGSGKKEAVKNRLNELEKSYKEFFGDSGKAESVTEADDTETESVEGHDMKSVTESEPIAEDTEESVTELAVTAEHVAEHDTESAADEKYEIPEAVVLGILNAGEVGELTA